MDTDKAYIWDNLYLPKKKIRTNGIINSLTFRNGRNIIKSWGETETHLIIPRYYLHPDKYKTLPFPFIDICPKEFPKVNIESNIIWRDTSQEAAFQFMSSCKNGILNLNTGKGKTVIALQRIATGNVPSLIVVHNTYLKQQWLERINELLYVPDGIGSIEGTKMDWQKPIVIGMILTLAKRLEKGTLPDGFKEWFGNVIYDEVHHLSAPVFSKTASLGLGSRYGLSATPKRADGMDCIIKYHLGDIFYQDMSYDLVPEIVFIEVKTEVNTTSWDNVFSLITKVSQNKYAIDVRYRLLKQLYEEDRKIIALSSRLELMDTLAAKFPAKDVCVINEKTPIAERSTRVKNSKITLAIGRLGLEGLDDKDLDTLVLLTPLGGDESVTETGKEYIGSQIRQAMGRVLRASTSKKSSKVYIFDDINVEPLTMLNYQLQIFFKRNGFEFKTIQLL